MARIPISTNFTVIPEGTYVFRITNATYDEKFGKVAVSLETANGKKHTEFFRLLDKNGNPNDGAYSAFSMLAVTAMQDRELQNVDPSELIGRYFEATVVHDKQPSTSDPTKTVTFVRLNDKKVANGFPAATTPTPASAGLSALLGGK